MAQRPPDRQADPRGHDHHQGAEPQHGPPEARDGMADERRARVDLVRERQEQREVRVQVDRPPGLVRHPPAGEPVGRDAGGEQRDRADGRREDAGIGPEQLAELVQRADLRLPRVADGDQHRVREQEVQGPRAEPAVPGDQAVLADRALERRDARDEQDDDDHRVGGEQPGQTAECGRDTARRAQ